MAAGRNELIDNINRMLWGHTSSLMVAIGSIMRTKDDPPLDPKDFNPYHADQQRERKKDEVVKVPLGVLKSVFMGDRK